MSITGSIIAGVGLAGSLGGAAISSHAAGKAASTQANAADYAANLQHQDAQAALQFQQQQYSQSQANMAPWLNTGRGALTSLADLLGVTPSQSTTSSGAPVSAAGPGFNATSNVGGLLGAPQSRIPAQSAGVARMAGLRDGNDPTSNLRFANENGVSTIPNRGATATVPAAATPSANFGSLLKGWDTPFNAPTDVTEQNDPGYKARLQQGQQLLENSAASRGGLLSTGTAKDLTKFGSDYASNEYSNVYNRSLNEYRQQYDIFNNNQTNTFNRLAALSGVGQTAASNLSSSGQAAAGNIGSILLNSGQQIGQNINNAAAARASGYVGSANAYGGALSSGAGNIGQLLMLKQLGLLGGNGLGTESSILNSDGSVPFINP